MEIIILVDYDNIDHEHRKLGLLYLSEKILETIDKSVLAKYKRAKIKLYGGWYNEKILTKNAQKLVADIESNFPATLKYEFQNLVFNVSVNVELAYSLEVEPSKHLFYTYRNRSVPWGLKCQPISSFCGKQPCSITNIDKFINDKKCPESECQIKLKDLILNGEQKLVDSMMTADIIYLSNNSVEEIVVVSSDDDMWPGIRTALIYGSKVHHVHTRREISSSANYSDAEHVSYNAISIWGKK